MKNRNFISAGFALLPVLLVILALVVVGGGAYAYYNSLQIAAPQPVACTQEAKICPDGSSVGRTGPNCEFAACPQTTVQAVTQTPVVMWELTDKGSDQYATPHTAVAVKINKDSYTVGTYTGTCMQIGGAGSVQLLPNEVSAVQCWFGGGGDEVGVFKDGAKFVIKVGQLDEGSYYVVGSRDNFKIVSPVAAVPTSVSVPGMSQYTETDFGFSFWYPSGWQVTIAPVSESEKHIGETGTLKKRLVISSNKINGSITLNEIHSTNSSITGGNPAKVGAYDTFYFDADAHTWMDTTTPAGGATGVPQTKPAALINTMGGLHMFTFNGTFGQSIAVPLSAKNFLTTDSGGDFTDQALVNTIVATDPSVATPVSAAEQQKTIEAEKAAYAGQ